MLGKLGWLRLPPLGVGLGIYLPMTATLPVVLGAAIGHVYDRWARRSANPETAERLGVLAATGLIVGESLWGVGFAGIVYLTNADAPLALVGDGFATPRLSGNPGVPGAGGGAVSLHAPPDDHIAASNSLIFTKAKPIELSAMP
ncbi:hypothetical protein SPKIRA_18590 [Sphingomonas paucimobilis]|nr:hypothetical protein SPKIRA_18590 [Sphingomonas paucimobilis]